MDVGLGGDSASTDVDVEFVLEDVVICDDLAFAFSIDVLDETQTDLRMCINFF